MRRRPVIQLKLFFFESCDPIAGNKCYSEIQLVLSKPFYDFSLLKLSNEKKNLSYYMMHYFRIAEIRKIRYLHILRILRISSTASPYEDIRYYPKFKKSKCRDFPQ